jgi:hypothetical protein
MNDNNRWYSIAGIIAVVQFLILIIVWSRNSKTSVLVEEKIPDDSLPIEATTEPSPVNESTQEITPPNPVVGTMYLEIVNIVQGINIAILVYVVTTANFLTSLRVGHLSIFLIAATSLLIMINFWIRYYLDTEILHRSFTVFSITWFFIFLVVQGIAISFV